MFSGQEYFQAGARLNGRYRVTRYLGMGGMGTVLAVEDEELRGELLALKLIHQHYALNETAIERFRSEVLLARKLVHQHIVRVFEFGTTNSGQLFITMEYVNGKALSEIIDDSRERLPIDESMFLLYQIADALRAAHRLKIVHRDVKPDNILVSKEGVVKLTDFGVARSLSESQDLTQTGALLGTPFYMAPEQISGSPTTTSCDVYSFGISAWELLAGRKPYVDDSYFALANKHLHEAIPDLLEPAPQCPEWLRLLVNACMAKDPSKRPSMERVCEEFEQNSIAQGKHSLRKAMEILSVVQQQDLELFAVNERKKNRKRKRNRILLALAIVLLPVVLNRISVSTHMRVTQLHYSASPYMPDWVMAVSRYCFGIRRHFRTSPLASTLTHVASSERSRYQTIGLIRALNPETPLLHERSQNGETPLIVAARVSGNRVMRELLKKNLNVHLRDNQGNTALHHAVQRGHYSVVSSLLDAGANLYARNNNNLDSVELGLKHSYSLFAYVLEKRMADKLSYRTEKDETLLHLIAIRLAELADEASVLGQNQETVSVEFWEVVRGFIEISNRLYAEGVRLDTPDSAGQTAVDLYREIPSEFLQNRALQGAALTFLSPVVTEAGTGNLT